MPVINPEVLREAELFTDGPVTDAVLASVAAMRDLPLYIELPVAAPIDRLPLLIAAPLILAMSVGLWRAIFAVVS